MGFDVYTPWGEPDEIGNVAPGIRWFSTPGHGGYRLDAERWAEFRALLPSFRSFTGDFWLEEDCDWVGVVALRPELFTNERCEIALRNLLVYRNDIDPSYWKTKQGQVLLSRALKEER